MHKQTTRSQARIAAVYVETLLSQQLSLGASWSFSDIQADEAVFSYTGHRNRFQAGVSWFLPQGLSMKLSGVLEETDLDISARNKSLQPEINWYTLQNHLRVNLKGKWEESAMSGVDDHVDEISLNLFWYY